MEIKSRHLSVNSVPDLTSPKATAAPDVRQLRDAREQFADLLSRSDTREFVWQGFFAQHPYVLSVGLPIKLLPQDFVPLGRPGRSEPDLIFYPRHTPRQHPSYGVIELKRPDHKILTEARKDVLKLSSNATTAVAQSRQYLTELEHSNILQLKENALFLGTSAYVFIVMGLSPELERALVHGLHDPTLTALLPPNFQIIPYDHLYRIFAANVPPRFLVAVPYEAIGEVRVLDVIREYLQRFPDKFDGVPAWMLSEIGTSCPYKSISASAKDDLFRQLDEVHFEFKASTPWDDDVYWAFKSPFDQKWHWWAAGLGGGFNSKPYVDSHRPHFLDED